MYSATFILLTPSVRLSVPFLHSYSGLLMPVRIAKRFVIVVVGPLVFGLQQDWFVVVVVVVAFGVVTNAVSCSFARFSH